MLGKLPILLVAALALIPAPASADTIAESQGVTGGGGSNLPPYLQCVPYARQVSGIEIRGDAWTWWQQAEGHYARGPQPKVGAVMAFKPYGRMELGHVAAVSRIIDSRTVLLRHANWSPINGRRGQVEDDVAAVDVSPENDWSEVRVWFDPIQNLGATHWPVAGFIYPKKAKSPPGKARLADTQIAKADLDDPIGAIIQARLAER
ncbi:CHAP domain-containing protein [Novosphingobium flavum]|uniref:CHAP domain-containing protein n=1 Tax=Novosphingobium flavum TaxID=1778672 RepID=A0A7X1KN21_9SPHN|nr:CHAP domain-containing protein [Novosphingobium flavum]MBC2667244.1 CHAP domain-containing protein [Novosphingobium flavum]